MNTPKSVLSLLFFALLASSSFAQNKIKALIVDGQNNHEHWPKITVMMKTYMEKTGLFEVDIQRTQYTWRGEEFLPEYQIEGMPQTEALEKSKQDPNFAPEFKGYDLVVINFGWDAAPWPKSTHKSFEKFVKKGGGVVIVHAADNSFPEWEAYNKMIGLGGWGDRNEKDGPYVYFDRQGVLQRDMKPGPAGSHGPQHEFRVEIREPEHPITKGMPEIWRHTSDELYDGLRGPAQKMTILATAFSAPFKRGTNRHEPMMMTIDYKRGRIFHTPMGHDDESWECVGLMTTFLRGAEWAATKKVTIPIPEDFPTERFISKRKFD
ncbi:ThuA domain-containing protein [Jiulongibacter sediminis]|jgi:type 1 glutamine amidotransferase|uniref:ThuA domain-containing protein n=1 Tax=Jiulongibacter sediminis TaxID=1605367 RepID=UPI0026EAB18B|nr:ThuA domain-containing protein [Jiulongibacter sediminis]